MFGSLGFCMVFLCAMVKTYIYIYHIWMFPKIADFPPKLSILIGFSIINHPFWGTLFLETPIYSAGNTDKTLFFWEVLLPSLKLILRTFSKGPYETSFQLSIFLGGVIQSHHPTLPRTNIAIENGKGSSPIEAIRSW